MFLVLPAAPVWGGGATAGFRISPEWQVVLDVNGCEITGLRQNLSGDSLSYMAGFRWTPPIQSRWTPYVRLLGGGNKIAQELMLPSVKKSLTTASAIPDHDQYTRQFEGSSVAFAAGTGMDVQINRALAVRMVNLEYTRSWVHELNGFSAPNGLQLKTGLVLHMGNW
jgi:hypothetical protein